MRARGTGAWFHGREPAVWANHLPRRHLEWDLAGLRMRAFVFTVVRDPLERCLSQYHYRTWRHPNAARSSTNASDALLVFLRGELCNNYAFHYLKPVDDNSEPAAASGLDLRSGSLDAADGGGGGGGEEDVTARVGWLESAYDLIGTTTMFDETMVTLAAALKIPLGDVLYLKAKVSSVTRGRGSEPRSVLGREPKAVQAMVTKAARRTQRRATRVFALGAGAKSDAEGNGADEKDEFEVEPQDMGNPNGKDDASAASGRSVLSSFSSSQGTVAEEMADSRLGNAGGRFVSPQQPIGPSPTTAAASRMLRDATPGVVAFATGPLFAARNVLDRALVGRAEQRLAATVTLYSDRAASLAEYQRLIATAHAACAATTTTDRNFEQRRDCYWNDNGCGVRCLDAVVSASLPGAGSQSAGRRIAQSRAERSSGVVCLSPIGG